MQVAIEIARPGVPGIELPAVAPAVRWELAVLAQLALREARLQYRGTALGVLWSVASPLAMAAVYLGLFSGLLGAHGTADPRTLLAALIPWSGFAAALCAAAHAPLTHAALLRGHRVPVRTVVAAAGLAALPGLLAGLALLSCAAPRALALIALPALVLAQLALALAAGQLLALANLVARDTQHALHYVLRLGFFATPILWLPRAGSWAELNPLAGIIAGYRSVLVQGALPDPSALLPALVWGTTLLAAGLAAERRMGRRVAELL